MSNSRPAAVSRATESNDHILRNEIYELTKACQSLRQALSAEMDENERLLAENERLLRRVVALCEESIRYSTQCDELKAEIERLRAELNEWYSAWGSPLREKQEGER